MSAARAERLKQVANRATLLSSAFFMARTQTWENNAADSVFATLNYKALPLAVT
jgi:hypothetical protein